MKRVVRQFAGLLPGRKPHLLPGNAAVTASNVQLQQGSLDPRPTDLAVNTPAKAGTKRAIYRFGKDLDSDTQYWFHWLNDTDVTRGPIPDDAAERTYYTEAGQPPKVTDSSIALASTAYPHASYLLGQPQPAKPNLAVSGAPSGTTPATRIYATYTYVTGWGEQGPPAVAPSDGADWQPGQTVTVSNMALGPAGAYNVTQKNIYVAITDANGQAVLRYWATVPVAQASYAAVLDATLLAAGERLEEPFLLAPPADLFGIMAHPNLFLVGFSGKRFCRSEVERPHGWPDKYQDPLPYDIVGGAIIGSTTVICTKGLTDRAEGIDPLNQAIAKVEGLEQPCLSKRSIVSGDGGVFYAGPDGVVLVPAAGPAAIVSGALLTPSQWKAYKPESMLFAYHDGQLLAIYDTGAAQGTLLFDFARASLTTMSLFATAAYNDPRRNELFLMVGNDIVKFEGGGARRTMVWRSGDELTPETAMCAGRVIAAAYPLTYRLYGDNTLRHTQSVASAEPFPMPGNYTARRWSFEVEATAEVTEAGYAEMIDEFGDDG